MSLNSLGGTGGYYYPGLYGSSHHGARNKHVGGFTEDDAGGGNNTPAANVGSTNATTPNLTPYAPQATGTAQQSGTSTDPSSAPVSGTSPTQASGSASDAFAPEQSLLTTLVGKSLEAMGLVSQSDLAGTKISFDAMSYDVESSITAAAGQQGQQVGAALDESQSATLQGEGQITTPDGTVYDFQVQLQVGDEIQAGATQTLGNSSDASSALAGVGGAAASDGAQNAQGVSGVDGNSSDPSGLSSNYLAQLVDAMTQTAAQAFGNSPDSFLQSAGLAAPASAASGQATQTAGAGTASGPSINWDAIQKQTSGLIDLLNALVTANQGASSSATGGDASNSAANGSSNAGTVAGSTPVTATNPATTAVPSNKSVAQAATV